MEKKVIFVVITLVVIVCFIIVYLNPNPIKKEKYCVEWNNMIYRDNMFLNCYDFGREVFGCLWYIDNNDILYIYEGTNDTKIAHLALNDFWKKVDNLTEIGRYNCTRHIWSYF